MIFTMIFLTGALMFSVGLLVGSGMKPVFEARHGDAADHGGGPEAAGSGHEPGSRGRQPASVDASALEKAAPGARLKKAFRESKQQALVEMSLRDQTLPLPRSVVDARASRGSDGSADRSPASAEESTTAAAVAPQNSREEKRSGKSNVRGLFERAPAAKDVFEPVSGQYTVQVASYATLDEGQARLQLLRKAGFNETYVVPIVLEKGETWYRVAVGSYPNSDRARKTGQLLVRRQLSKDFVIRQVP